MTSGNLAAIVVGSIFGLVFIALLVFVGKKKNTAALSMDLDIKSELAAKDAPVLHEVANSMYPGAELEGSKDIQEMKSNEEVGQEMPILNVPVSELPA